MSSNIDDLTVEYEEDGLVLVRELDKVVLSKGAWTTILFRYRELNRKTEEFGPEKYTIRRYRKIHDAYRQQSKFNISSKKQAAKIVEALSRWIEDTD
ncbi:MAG: hypothetical protein ACOC0U_06385 [Desulfovibrionales bacterium]